MKTNGNELIRRLLSGITNDELQNLVRVREEARRSIPAMRWEKQDALSPRRRIPVPAPQKRGGQTIMDYCIFGEYFECIVTMGC